MQTCSKKWVDVPFAHRQPNHDGHCRQIHGHNWSIEVTFAAGERDKAGFIVDFGGPACKEMKGHLDNVFDHKLILALSDPLVKDPNFMALCDSGVIRANLVDDASCEGLAKHFYHVFSDILSRHYGQRAWITQVTVWEDHKNSASFHKLG